MLPSSYFSTLLLCSSRFLRASQQTRLLYLLNIHVYLQKPMTYSKLFFWDLHGFYHELVVMKEAFKAIGNARKFSFFMTQEISDITCIKLYGSKIQYFMDFLYFMRLWILKLDFHSGELFQLFVGLKYCMAFTLETSWWSTTQKPVLCNAWLTK